jgi:hypothetical protein
MSITTLSWVIENYENQKSWGILREWSKWGESQKTKTGHNLIPSKNSAFGNISGDWVRLPTISWTTTAAVL